MIGLLQRVTQACVKVDDKTVARIETGLVVLIGVEKDDTVAQADRLTERLLGYRVFPDMDNKMNLCLKDIAGGLLLVPQFTLPADTRKGMRPSFSSAASPETARRLFEYLVEHATKQHSFVEAGVFGADMQITLTNDGPVTFWLQTP
jgi:D-tyrosyl-tRNA(Tyr) deacylase